jgi:hypothetical protein
MTSDFEVISAVLPFRLQTVEAISILALDPVHLFSLRHSKADLNEYLASATSAFETLK